MEPGVVEPSTDLMLTDEEIALLTPDELKRYKQLLVQEIGMRSPLDLACVLAPETKRYPHVEMLNDHIVALTEYRLYDDGPGPESVLYYTLRDYDTGEVETHRVGEGDEVPFDNPDLEEYFRAHPDDPDKRVKLRLGIAMPPRHGKSYMVSEWLPVWYWLRHPDMDMALATYSDEFASSEWGVKLRDKLIEHGELLDLVLKGGERAPAHNLRLEAGKKGRMKLVGCGGSLTGTGWLLGIIDDPFKDSADAQSAATRKARGDWYDSTFISRKTKKPGMIPVEIMMFTRWHEDDLAGQKVYDENGNVRPDWFMLHIPAIALDEDPLGRRPGEALCSAIMTIGELRALRTSNPLWFASLYQGMPAMLEGGKFGTFHYYISGKRGGRDAYLFTDPQTGKDEIIYHDECVRFETVDLAATVQSYSDYSVVSTWDFHRETQRMFLYACVRERIESDEHPRWLIKHHNSRSKFMGIESKTFGLTAIQNLRKTASFVVRSLKAEGDKIARAIPAQDMNMGGRLFFNENDPQTDTLTAECGVFPNGRHDDFVDTLGYAAIEAAKFPRPLPQKDPKNLTVQEKIDRQIDRQIKRNRRSRRRT